MNKTRPLLLLCFLLLAGLFAINSHAGEVTIKYEGGTYIGEVSNGVPNGQGTYTWSDGTKYVGEYKDGKIHGQGTVTFADGRRYVGQFKNEECDGQGTYTWSDGHKLSRIHI